MPIGRILGAVAGKLDRTFGQQAMRAGGARPPGGVDIKGEKLLNWGYICSCLPHGRKMALEIGSGDSPIVPAMVALGYDVTTVRVGTPCADASVYAAGIHSVPGDFMRLDLGPGFDVIVACSTIERIGLTGRHRSEKDPDGDLKAMRAIAGILKRNGLFFLTVPVGRDTVIGPWRRVYGRERLPRLLAGFDLVDYRFMVKEPRGPWAVASADAALGFPVDEPRHAIGQMILRNELDVGQPRI